MAEINWNILDPNAPQKAAMSIDAGQQNALARVSQQQQQQMQSMGLQKATQDMADDNALRKIYQQSGGDMNATLQGLQQAGLGKQSIELQGKMLEQQKAKISQAVELTKVMRDSSMQIYTNPDPALAVAKLQEFEKLSGKDMTAEIQKVSRMTPPQLQQWSVGHIATADQIMPKLMNIDQGGQTSIVPVSQFTGEPMGVGSSFQKTADPNKQPSGGTPYFTPMQTADGAYSFDNRKGTAAPVLVDGKPIIGTNSDPTLQGDISKKKEAGKTSAEREAKSVEATKKAAQISTQLDQAETLLKLDPTSSVIGKAVDSSAAVFGKATSGAKVAAELETLSGWLTANVPRMEGPQSNYDVDLYKSMAADVGNSKIPIETRMAKVKRLRELQGKFEEINKQFRASSESAPSTNQGGIKFLGFE